MITESQVKAALRVVGYGERSRIELRDEGERSAGRLMLIVRKTGERTVAEFYAARHRGGKRAMSKLGSFPVSLAAARQRFRKEFAPAIASGAEPASAAARRRHRAKTGTVKDLFEAYVGALREAGKRAADSATRRASAFCSPSSMPSARSS